MKQIWNWIKNNPNRAMFLVPILLVAGISISHVVTWYDMANPINWAIYLSIAIEVGAITALVAATNRIKGGIWFMFGIVTFIQMIGNIFYSYKEIDPNGDLFKSWVELTGPVWELMGTELTDIVGMKRWLAFLEGGLLPIISLTSLHFFVKYEDSKDNKEKIKEDYFEARNRKISEIVDGKEEPENHWQKEAERVWKDVERRKEAGEIYEPTEEDLANEPTALANSGYRERAEMESFESGDQVETEEDAEWDEDHALDTVTNQMISELSEEEIEKLFDEETEEENNTNEEEKDRYNIESRIKTPRNLKGPEDPTRLR